MPVDFVVRSLKSCFVNGHKLLASHTFRTNGVADEPSSAWWAKQWTASANRWAQGRWAWLLVGFPLALFRRSVWLLSGVIYDASYCVLGSTAPVVSGAGALAAVSNWSHLCPACYEWVGVLPVVCAPQLQQHRCKRQGVHISRSLGWSGAATAKAPSFLPGMAGLSLSDEVRPLLCSSTLRSLEKLLTSLASGWLNFSCFRHGCGYAWAG